MNFVGAIVVVVLFAVLVHVLKLVKLTREVVSISRQSLAIVKDPSVDDDAKEKSLQGNALRLFALLFLLIAAGLVALLGPLGLVWLLGLSGILSFGAVLGTLLRWDFMVAATVFGTAAYFRLSGRRR